MKKPSPNIPCPCGSGRKYKRCCQPYHRGARPGDALTLMKSRYAAYALAQPDYIIRTTHPNNPDWQADTTIWRESILAFSRSTEFRRLEILDVVDGETESFVTFRAVFGEGEMVEKSRFLLEEEGCLYESGEFLL